MNYSSRNYVEMLDFMEKKVESMREKASAIETERETLISNLGRLKLSNGLKRFTEEEKDEIEATAQRLMNRILTVEVKVVTPRNDVQKKALKRVNKIVDDLLISMKADPINSKRLYNRYLNACLSDSTGPIDLRFQTLLLDCAGDDQKRIRRRLEAILDSKSHSMDIDGLMDVD